MSSPLITKYRPQDFNQVVGNEAPVRSLEAAIKSDSCPHAFLFTGPSGVGKTTLARIIAKHVNATINEIDAASNSGIDDTRALALMSGFTSIMSKNTLHIIDECHNLSPKAWEPLLKLIEEPPKHIYIALCTTEAEKVKPTIKTRCFPIQLKALKTKEISDFLEVAASLEGMKVADDVFNAIVYASEGSPRLALTYLQAGYLCKTTDELNTVVTKIATESSIEIKLATILLNKGEWTAAVELINQIDDYDAAVTIISRYLTGCALKELKAPEKVKYILKVISTIKTQENYDKKIQLVLAIGAVLLSK